MEGNAEDVVRVAARIKANMPRKSKPQMRIFKSPRMCDWRMGRFCKQTPVRASQQVQARYPAYRILVHRQQPFQGHTETKCVRGQRGTNQQEAHPSVKRSQHAQAERNEGYNDAHEPRKKHTTHGEKGRKEKVLVGKLRWRTCSHG